MKLCVLYFLGRPHEKEFSIRCTVLKFCEIGSGKSKKIAKRQAAQRIYEKLQNLSLDQSEVVQIAIDEANDEVSLALIISSFLGEYSIE